jgi:hypothetical protein
MANATDILVRSAGYTDGVMTTLPIKTEKQNIAIAIESTCPSDRMVATMLEAIPRNR